MGRGAWPTADDCGATESAGLGGMESVCACEFKKNAVAASNEDSNLSLIWIL